MTTSLQVVEGTAPMERVRLSNTDDIRRELAAVYREAKLGRLPTSEATRLAYMLDLLRRGFEQTRLEQRIAHIEALLAAQAKHDAEKLENKP